MKIEEFLRKAEIKHGYKYDYSLVKKKAEKFLTSQIKMAEFSKTKIESLKNRTIDTNDIIQIVCPVHGVFERKVSSHLYGDGCPECQHNMLNNIKEQKRIVNKRNFIEKAREKHGDKYDYSKVNYINSRTKVCIICPDHGEFWQSPNSHLNGSGCPKCAAIYRGETLKNSAEEFIEKAREKHGDKYDYSKVNYINAHTKVCIVCPEHGEFWQRPVNHLNGTGCPKCKNKIKK